MRFWLALAFALAAGVARADIAPPSMRQCENEALGAPCVTDRGVPGTCAPIACTRTAPNCWDCRQRDGGASCDEFCKRISEPCAACVAYDRKPEVASDVYRWNDCIFHKVGEACRTPSCLQGVCKECGGDDCRFDTVCVAVAPPSRRGPYYVIGAGACGAMGLLAWVLVLRRRRFSGASSTRPSRAPRPPAS